MKKNVPRRDFLKQTALAAGAAAMPSAATRLFAQAQQGAAPVARQHTTPVGAAANPQGVSPPDSVPRPRFPTADPAWQKTWDAALAVLAGNVRTLTRYDRPVLVEGSTYGGIWQECAPQEGLVYGSLAKYVAAPPGGPTPLAVARANHMAFFAQQREDGQLPAAIKLTDSVGTTGGYGQIQMVVPIAATAWELAQQTSDDELLVTAYQACSRWDAWLRDYRDTRKTGLVEGFCTYDTGHDNSPRWAGIPNRCPDADARKCPAIATMPRLCPDLSATVYGAHVLDPVKDKAVFEAVWTKEIHNPKAFWAPYPLSSIAMDDPTFVRPIPRNSWGGASQALTALRAPRWMPFYGKQAELAHMMQQWCSAILRHAEFRQQMDPLTGDFTQADPGGYSPAALVFLDFARRLSRG